MRSQVSIFQSTPSAWRETTACQELFPAENISIHSLRMEGDGHSQKNTPTFNISIHSLRMEGDYTSTEVKARYNDFNPLPPHGGRPKTDPKKHTYQQISIHSLRMEGDGNEWCIFCKQKYFNPLPPHGGRREVISCLTGTTHFNPLPPHGGRLFLAAPSPSPATFQSTPSAWRETYGQFSLETRKPYFNPLPPHGGRHQSVFFDFR